MSQVLARWTRMVRSLHPEGMSEISPGLSEAMPGASHEAAIPTP